MDAVLEGRNRGRAEVLLVPHASYDFIAGLCGAAFAAAADRPPATVVLAATVHRDRDDAVYLPEEDSFATPLGPVPVRREVIERWTGRTSRFRLSSLPHREEHSLEIQLPFVKRLFPGADLVPVLAGGLGGALADLRDALVELEQRFEGPFLYVLSSNLSRYDDRRAAEAEADRFLVDALKGDWADLRELGRKGLVSACGTGLLSVLMPVLGTDLAGRVVGRERSDRREDGRDKCILYGALAWEKGGP